MLLARLLRFGVLPVLISGTQGIHHDLRVDSDPCSKIAGKAYVEPIDAVSCLSSFPSNETLKQNVLNIVSGSLDFYTWEANYLNLSSPFHKESWDIRAEIGRINETRYDTDYQFNRDLFEAMHRLNDGHTYYQTNCYNAYFYYIPTPIVLLDTGIHIAPDLATLSEQLGLEFEEFYERKGFNWKRLAGAEVHEIGGVKAWEYINYISNKIVGTFLDENVRMNGVFSSYRMPELVHEQTQGYLAARNFLMETSLEFSVVPVNTTSNEPERVKVPFVAAYHGEPFKDKESYWANNCLANKATNGVDLKPSGSASRARARAAHVASIRSRDTVTIIGRSHPFDSTLSPINRSISGLESHILPQNKTGVLYVGSFLGDLDGFQKYVHESVQIFKERRVENIMVDVTNNFGGDLCLANFFEQYLAGTKSGFPGFQSTLRANLLAQKIVKSLISLNVNQTSATFYTPDAWQFPNGTQFPHDFDYTDPAIPVSINNHEQPTSQRFRDNICPTPVVTMPETPPFDLEKVVIFGNGNCASACAIFTTAMRQKHDTRIVTFGGQPNRSIEYKGTAGNQEFDWTLLDSEIKTADLKNNFPQEFIVNAAVNINWRNAYSWRDPNVLINFESDPSLIRLNYTKETYNNPRNNWLYLEIVFPLGQGHPARELGYTKLEEQHYNRSEIYRPYNVEISKF